MATVPMMSKQVSCEEFLPGVSRDMADWIKPETLATWLILFDTTKKNLERMAEMMDKGARRMGSLTETRETNAVRDWMCDVARIMTNRYEDFDRAARSAMA